jgi:transposase
LQEQRCRLIWHVAEENIAEEIAQLKRENQELKAENERLRRLLEEALRTSKRQAAPFSRQKPKAHPQKPGRKPGQKYGRRCRRPVPERIDEVLEVPLPARCPRCGGGLEECETVSQFQTEIPQPRVDRIEFRIHVGRCRCCRGRVQGRHPRQTSNAIGGAASQLGPRALALATLLNKGLGLPYGKAATVLEQAFGLRVSRGGLCQAMERMAEKAEPTYQALVEQVRGSPSVTPDETGWKVGGQLWWMWVFSTAQVTVYAIQPGRGFEQAARVLGADFAGFLVRDGWAVYRGFLHALHQSCLAHLLRRCREMILVGGKREAEFPRRIQALLQQALQLRDRRQQEQISDHGVAVARGRLEARLDRSLQHRYRALRNRRLANHLLRERDALFTFLNCPGLEATNWRAEQAIRPMVVARKVWGGNRTARGAQTQSILVSFLQTCRQQLQPASSLLQNLLCSSQPKVLDLAAPAR